MYLATIKADRIVVRYQKDVRFGDGAINVVKKKCRDYVKKVSKSNVNRNSLLNLSKSKSTVELSSTSKRNLKDSIQLLYQLSSPRKVKIADKRFIYNYRASFITLTLPSKQNHSDVEIKRCLDRFLTRLRNDLNVSNYVWKCELQRNQNIHFHLVIDKYCSFQSLRYYWNLTTNKLGYVDAYSTKFSKMSLLDYSKYRGLAVEKCKDAYVKGCKSNWSSPNSVDVKSLNSSKQVAYYLSKYFTKDFSKNDDSNVDVERIKSFGRVWSRSQSISSIKLITRWDWSSISMKIKKLFTKKNVITKIYDYCTVHYIQFKSQKCKLVEWLRSNLIYQAKYFNYPFPIDV